MNELLGKLFSANFMPHAHCFFWQKDLLSLHVISDAVIALAYYVIPLGLIYIIRRRDDLAFNWMFVLFATFIFACGTTHVFDVITMWYPYYYAQGLIKLFTAAVSITTAIALWKIIPQIFAVPSAHRLRELNTLLAGEVRARKRAQRKLRRVNHLLEQRVQERTARIQKSNAELESEIAIREGVERSLRLSEQRYRSLVTVSSSITWTASMSGAFTEPQLSWKEFTGQDWPGQQGYGWLSVFHPDDMGTVSSTFAGVLASRGSFEVDARLWHERTNAYRYVTVRGVALKSSEGDINGWIGTISDIDDKRREHERLIAIIESAPNSLIMVDGEGRIRLINSQTEALFGYRRDELIGQNIEVLVPQDLRDQHIKDRVAYIRKPVGRAMGKGRELFAVRKDGAQIAVEIGLNPVSMDGETYVLSSILDISERKKTEHELNEYREHLERLVEARTHDLFQSQEQLRQSERMASVGALAAGIAHEINNPVGAIWLASQNALEEVSSQHSAEDVGTLLKNTCEKIVRNANRCRLIVKGILQFARQEPSDKWANDINEVIRSAVHLGKDAVHAKHCNLELQLSDGLPLAQLNPLAIEQVVLNLLKNAIEASPDGATIAIESDANHATVVIRCRDHGSGIKEHDLARVFDPFYTTKQHQGGTGLGLSIVHGIIQEHEGSIQIDSSPGRGTTVTINIPIANVCSAQPAPIDEMSVDTNTGPNQ